LASLRKLAESYQQNSHAVADEDVPDLVKDFEEATIESAKSKLEEIDE